MTFKKLINNHGAADASRQPKRISKKTALILSGIVVLVIIIGLVFYQRSAAEKAASQPGYQTVLPKDSSIKQLGGWKRISPPGNDPVFAYADQIDSVPISVSQQPLPTSFRSDTANQVAELAKKFNATNKIDAGHTAVYIGTSAKGPQSIIFTKNNLLILIRSQNKIADTSWARYAESLINSDGLVPLENVHY